MLRIHTHWQVTQSCTTRQNLPKSMAAQKHGHKEKIKHRHTTLAIRNVRETAKMKAFTLNELFDKRKVKFQTYTTCNHVC